MDPETAERYATGAPAPDVPQPSRSRLVRWLLIALGSAFVALAALGAVLPVLPTTPFLLVAAACFARSSPRFYEWLLANRAFGPLIRNWRATRSIPRRAKATAIAAIALCGAASVALLDSWPSRVGVVAVLLIVIAWILSVPTTERLPVHRR